VELIVTNGRWSVRCPVLSDAFLPLADREFSLSPGVPLAIRSGPAQCEIQDIQVADHWQKESMMNANAIGNRALRHRKDGSADDRHDHHSGTVPGQWAKF